jgi:hypothetical protein
VFCLSDNDVVFKLAACDLLDDALAALNVTRSDVYVLPRAKYVLARMSEPYGVAVCARVNDFLESVQIIPWTPPPDEVLLFEDTMGIDIGESLLYSVTAVIDEDYMVATGDKVSLRALANTPECQPIVDRLAGHVVCLEQIVLRCITCSGFSTVKKKVVPARGCDTALRAIFGSGLTAAVPAVREGLNSYIDDLRSSTGGLLMP